MQSPHTSYEALLGLVNDQVDFEGNAQIVVNAVNTPEVCLAWYGERIEDVKIFLIQNPLWRVSFTYEG